MTHDVHLERDGPHARWACPCGWETEWTVYSDPAAGPAAVRHLIESTEETQ